MDPMIPVARTPEGFTEVRSWPLLTVDGLASIRRDLGSTLPGNPGGGLEDVPESVVLVVSELATNAIRHGGGPVTIRLFERDGECLIDVADRAPSIVPQIASGRAVGGGGFGLRLVAQLADQAGWYATASAKHVWARFRVPSRVPSLSV